MGTLPYMAPQAGLSSCLLYTYIYILYTAPVSCYLMLFVVLPAIMKSGLKRSSELTVNTEDPNYRLLMALRRARAFTDFHTHVRLAGQGYTSQSSEPVKK